MAGFPQYHSSSKQGEVGVRIVSRIVEECFGWLFKRNHQEHDFGIDGQIEVVTTAGAVTGQMLGCQIKCGPSFFTEQNRWGYVYRGETKHFNYLANYPLPVIIILCDPITKEAYWEVFDASAAEPTEAGWKLTVPFEHKLTSSKPIIEAQLPPVADHLAALNAYWKVNKLIMECGQVLFMIEPDEVLAGDISRVEDFRRRLTSTKSLALHCQGKIVFSFNEYDDDPRELFEIGEVKKYIALLDAALPELFFFARTEEPGSTLKLFVFALFAEGWEGERSTPGNPQKVIVMNHLMGPFLQGHFDSLNLIAEWVGLTEQEILNISQAVFKPLGYPPYEKAAET